MHQIRLWLGLRPRPLWYREKGRSPTPPDALAGFKGPASKERGGGQRRGRGKRKGVDWLIGNDYVVET